jgi:hypothetical protein
MAETMVKPVRIQRSRAKGSRLTSPNGLPVVCVSRGTKWGNPYKVGSEQYVPGRGRVTVLTHLHAVELYQRNVCDLVAGAVYCKGPSLEQWSDFANGFIQGRKAMAKQFRAARRAARAVQPKGARASAAASGEKFWTCSCGEINATGTSRCTHCKQPPARDGGREVT